MSFVRTTHFQAPFKVSYSGRRKVNRLNYTIDLAGPFSTKLSG